MKKSIFLIITAFSFLAACNKNVQNADDYKSLKQAFINPPSEARPKAYWWVLNGNLDTIRAKQELRAMKDAGITGFDFFEIGVHRQDTMIPGGPAFLSDESLKLIKFAVDEAGKLGLTVGFNLASSWNAGGSWVKPEHGGKSLYVSKIKIQGNSSVQKIKVPFPKISFSRESLIGGTDKPMIPFGEDGKPEYYEEVAILAFPAAIHNSLDTSQIIDVTPYFDPKNEILNWNTPEGNWEICRYVCSNSGQQVVRPSPLSAGLTIDHFDSTAVETHLMYAIDRLKTVLGDFRNTALKSFYLASYEARGFVWTSSLSEEFRNINGYSITKFIPSLFDKTLFSEDTYEMVQTDFKKTLSELMINNLYRKSKEICNRYGLKINSEAGGPGYPLYNGPVEPLKAQGALDIPRGEFWVNHSRFYKDPNGKDNIDILRVVKEAAAASHIYQKRFVEEEAFTSFQHWQQGPFDIKKQGDRAFCEGMNRVVFHGFSHNITKAGYPGYVYHAGTHFNDKRVWWTKIKPFVDYLSRISSVFQGTDFVADVVWYYGDKIPNSATPKNTHFKVGPGYDYEVINTDILLDSLSVKNGKLVLSNGAEYSVLALENEDLINPKVLLKVKELAEQRATISGSKPKGISQIKNSPLTKTDSENLINELWKEISSPEFRLDEKGKIYSGISSKEILEKMDIPSDLNYSDKETFLIDYIHFKNGDIHFYFVRNTSADWISRNLGFRQQNKIPEIWDPVSGKIIPVTIFDVQNQYINIPVTLPPYGSQLFVFKNGTPFKHYTDVSGNSKYPPLLEFKKDGISFLENGSIKLMDKENSLTIDNEIPTYTLSGEWEVSFDKEWGAPEKVSFPKLISWTESDNEGIKYYSGTGTYRKTFNYDKKNKDENEKIYLDLGEISKVAEVWLNGENLGITWTKPHKFDVTELIKNGENVLMVEVANVWSNRLTGDALTGEDFTNTNISATVLPVPTIKTGSQTRIPWEKVPLIESGLLGPVTLEKIKTVAVR